MRPSTEKAKDLFSLTGLAEARKISPVIDGRYLLEQTVETYRYADKGHNMVSVSITIWRMHA